MLARHLLRTRTGCAGAGCVPRRCYSSEQWSRLEGKASGVVQGLEQQGQTVGVAELASGGQISAALTLTLTRISAALSLTLTRMRVGLLANPYPDPNPKPKQV